MKTFGLTGYPLGHSFSAEWFAEKFRSEGIADARYVNFPLRDITGIRQLANDEGIAGFNVTIPHKETIIPYLDELSPEAEAIGAVNCVVRIGDRLKGYNTDWLGFSLSLEGFVEDKAISALILGSGGSSKAVAYALRKSGIRYAVVSRKKDGARRYEELDDAIISSNRLIMNTTPLGMYPDISSRPDIPYSLLGPGHYLYDLVYNPTLTAFLSEGQKQGCRIKNGMEMLRLQAEESWKIFRENL